MEMILYAVIAAEKQSEKLKLLLAGMKGISDADLYPVSCDEITAVVSDIAKAYLISDRCTAITYAGVVETLAQQFALLPMQFGSVMESSGAVENMLRRNHDEFRKNLQSVENRCEFGLKIFCDSEKLNAKLREKSETGNSTPLYPEPEIKNSVFREYVNKKLKEHRFEELLVTYVDAVIVEIKENLSRLEVVGKFKKMASATNIVDAVFLLEKGKENELIQTVKQLQNENQGLNYILTGPWPPYNFVEIAIK
jgi:hypothetical protein